MTTARTIIESALRTIGVTAAGEVPTAAEAQDALTLLNQMLDAWSLERLFVLANTITTKVLTAGQQTYTVGSGGDINITWPAQIEQAQLRVTQVTPNLDLPITVLNEQEYGLVRLKTEQSTYPLSLWLQTTFPLGTLYLWPVPNQANTLVLWTNGLVASFATLDTDVNLGRGYARALRYNLAVELCPEHGRTPPAEVIALALESRGVIKRANVTPQYAMLHVPAGMGRHNAYNWRIDSTQGY